jgi:hypothetical protein
MPGVLRKLRTWISGPDYDPAIAAPVPLLPPPSAATYVRTLLIHLLDGTEGTIELVNGEPMPFFDDPTHQLVTELAPDVLFHQVVQQLRSAADLDPKRSPKRRVGTCRVIIEGAASSVRVELGPGDRWVRIHREA